ncbi:MAG: RNA polymerase sigma factor [Chitinophagales bacterium]
MKISYIGAVSDDDLIKGCVAGDRKAQYGLYNKYAPKMFGICLRYAKDYHAAEDVLQDAFVKVFKYINKFRKEGSFEGWLRRIFVNTSIEHLRKSVNLYPIVNDAGEAIEIHDHTVFDSLEQQDLLYLVQELSPGYRTVFNLYAIEGYSHKEIAKLMGITEGTSKSQLARARQVLQRKITTTQKISLDGVS